MKRLIRKAEDEQLQELIRKCANDLEERIAHYESNYSGDGDPWDDDSFYDTIADVHMEMDIDFIKQTVQLLTPDMNFEDVQDEALDYLTNHTQDVDDNDYIKRYEILLAGVKKALSNLK